METLIIICVLFAGIFTGYLLHAKGVQDGIKLEKGRKVAILPQPIQKAKERKVEAEKAKEDEAFGTAVGNLLSYDGFKQKVGD